MQFSYKTVDTNGRMESGSITAPSREALTALFKDQGKVLLEVKAKPELKLQWSRGKFSNQERLNFTQQLAGLLEAGISIERALAILGRLSTDQESAKLIEGLKQSLHEGLSFTAALERYARDFSPIYISIVRAGEAGGILPEVLLRLTQYMEDELTLRRFIIGSLIYPAIVVVTSLGALLFFVSDIIPKFQEIFAGFDSQLPLITQVVMFCGTGLTRYGWVVLLGIGAVTVWCMKAATTAKGKWFFDRLKIQLPLIGEIQKKAVIAKMAMALGLLEQSGVPLLSGLRISAAVMGNEVYTRALQTVEQEVQSGRTLAQSMVNQKVFPALAIEMINVGEESGRLGEMLAKVAKTYEMEVKNAVGIFLAVFEPLLILLMVGMIAILAVAILLPIINMNAKIG